MGTKIVTVRAFIGVASEVCHRRVKQVVHPPGIRERTGRIHRAGEDISHRIKTGLSDRTDPQRRVNAVILFVDELRGNRVCAVDQHNNRGNIACILQLLQPFQNGALVFV